MLRYRAAVFARVTTLFSGPSSGCGIMLPHGNDGPNQAKSTLFQACCGTDPPALPTRLSFTGAQQRALLFGRLFGVNAVEAIGVGLRGKAQPSEIHHRCLAFIHGSRR